MQTADMDNIIYWLDSKQLPAFSHEPWMIAAAIIFSLAFNLAFFIVTARWSFNDDALDDAAKR